MSLLWHEKAPNTRHEELLWALWMRDWETNCWLIAQLSCFTAKGLKSLQLLSKSREVLLKNAEHKITNKLQAVMLFLFFSKHALYKTIESICYNNWVVLAGQIFQRTTMKLKRTECLYLTAWDMIAPLVFTQDYMSALLCFRGHQPYAKRHIIRFHVIIWPTYLKCISSFM